MRIDVSSIKLREVLNTAGEFPQVNPFISACAVAEQVVLEVV